MTLLFDLYCMTLIYDLGRCRVLILTSFFCSNEAAEVFGVNEMGDIGAGGGWVGGWAQLVKVGTHLGQ